jgi:hypothetical protein
MTVLKKAGGHSPAKEQGKPTSASALFIYSWSKYSFCIYQNIGTTTHFFCTKWTHERDNSFAYMLYLQNAFLTAYIFFHQSMRPLFTVKLINEQNYCFIYRVCWRGICFCFPSAETVMILRW